MKKFTRILYNKINCWKTCRRASFYVTNKNCHMWQFVCVHGSAQKMWHRYIEQVSSGFQASSFFRNQDGGVNSWLGGSSNFSHIRGIKNRRKPIKYHIRELFEQKYQEETLWWNSWNLLLSFFGFSTRWIIRNAAIPATILACLLVTTLVILYVSAVQSHFWHVWKLV